MARGYEIEKTYVSFKVAKLAKEAGFNCFCSHFFHLEYNIGELQSIPKFSYLNSEHSNLVTAPTQDELIEWLYNKGIFIDIDMVPPHIEGGSEVADKVRFKGKFILFDSVRIKKTFESKFYYSDLKVAKEEALENALLYLLD